MNEDINDKFVKYYFDSDKWHKNIYENATEGARNHGLLNITAQDFFASKLNISLNTLEQNRIGQLLSKLDDTITLLQRKKGNYEELKKSLLQNLFLEKNKLEPILRFKTFSNKWQQRKLSYYLKEYKEKSKINNQYPILTSSRKGIFFQRDYYDGHQIASKNTVGYNIVPRGYFTYRHMSDDLVFHFNINNLCDYGIVSTLYPVFNVKNNMDKKWLYYYLNNSNDMKKYALLQKQGGSRTYMYYSKLKNLSSNFPTKEEQKQIGNLLSKLDKTIISFQKQLDHLSRLKQFLLQNMFI
ncbi:restriction endonuclease subunit S [Lactobacillus sp. PV034]|uniref:restriction endonuclease subunit S n=1 Tax=Lactobacillus sp. PV034 TaxID=2594495 RepID=UPI002240CF04|nr:restriction endonuclease subunit S [Lactobacillus sp. PV034]QNQ80554.1 restriction endonuclease subunit S [Lactobacillus sp. PV034]